MSIDAARFWAKVDKSGDCWLWTGEHVGRYGRLDEHTENGVKHRRAHRVAYELTTGPIAAGLQVLHRCDNPPCVNPDHLFVGTRDDNMRDKLSKGRTTTGERHGMAKLTSAEVIDIRRRHDAGEPVAGLARIFRVSPAHAYRIVRGQRWASV